MNWFRNENKKRERIQKKTDIEALRRYLTLIDNRNKWECIYQNYGDRESVCEMYCGGETLVWETTGKLIHNGIPVTFELRLSLVKSLQKETYCVQGFRVELNGGRSEALQGHTVLKHHGKTYCHNEDSKGNFWEVKVPADLEFLLKEYDKLAELYESPRIFNLP